jgi:hypothetical protein
MKVSHQGSQNTIEYVLQLKQWKHRKAKKETAPSQLLENASD